MLLRLISDRVISMHSIMAVWMSSMLCVRGWYSSTTSALRFFRSVSTSSWKL